MVRDKLRIVCWTRLTAARRKALLCCAFQSVLLLRKAVPIPSPLVLSLRFNLEHSRAVAESAATGQRWNAAGRVQELASRRAADAFSWEWHWLERWWGTELRWASLNQQSVSALVSVDNLQPKTQALTTQTGIVKAAVLSFLTLTLWNLSLNSMGKTQCADGVYVFYAIYCLRLSGALPCAPSPFLISPLPQWTLNLLTAMEKKS